jgi:hypothetical protein
MRHARFAIIGGDLWGEQAPYVKELRELVKKHDLVSVSISSRIRTMAPMHWARSTAWFIPRTTNLWPRHHGSDGAFQTVIAMNENGRAKLSPTNTTASRVSRSRKRSRRRHEQILTNAELRSHLSANGRPSIEAVHIADRPPK